MPTILAKVIRNDRVESLHRGHIAISDGTGKSIIAIGDPTFRTYIRSAAKPFQIMPLLNDGVDRHFAFTDRELAVIIASHNGEAFHIEAVESLLKKTGLEVDRLQCAFHPPLHGPTAKKQYLQDAPKTPLVNNCSGKHSGMLAVAKFHGWPLETYLQPEHPVQKRILQVISRFSNLPEDDIGIGMDGCSAPVFYLPVTNMALMYASLAAGKIELSERVFDVMVTNPEMIAGTDRFDTKLMQVTRGRMVSKVGAEGVRCVGVRGERALGIALKVEDGSKRASETIMLEVLWQLDLISQEEVNKLSKYRKPMIANHAGIETGWVEPAFILERS
ncbi:asparaginase [candidate division KSB1 bacterium]|nr:asparaginase [candidate division KSB1 bacterium]NIR73121.1 asparaginase [candidate division KSB1 bacterium]NIS27856.1 asparaginase [candidate division KSB1 bacterium]NIT74739.1 asparaginase [candidate division KSB1 bacterium]NIU28521.1 asparaginase [candidate division KSB1 bacterium]